MQRSYRQTFDKGCPIRFLVLLAVLVFPVAAQAADCIGAVKSVVFYAYGSLPGDNRKPITSMTPSSPR